MVHQSLSNILTNQQIRIIVALRFGAVNHIPMIADQHSLLEQRRVRTRIAELSAKSVTHMIDL